jgi:peptide/nickel transport system permease protein
MVGFAAVILAGVLGVATGLAAGYYGRHTDQIVMRWVDVQMAFPTVVLAIAVLAILGNSFVNVIIVLTISSWVVYARLTRAVTLSIREKEFVEGAVAAGAGDVRILTRYILPNVLPSIIVIATYQFAAMVIAESALSFLGLGVPPPAPSWGSGISSGRDYLSQAWWVTTMPGVALMLTIMAVTLIGDWVRDRLDPTLGM